MDGRVVYVANNQLLLIDAAGAGRRVLVDGGPVDENNPFVSSVNDPSFSPDGQTLSYWHKGLNLHTVSTGESRLVLEKQRIDPLSGAPVPAELYLPQKYSPDGSRLLITIALPNSDGILPESTIPTPARSSAWPVERVQASAAVNRPGRPTGLHCLMPVWTWDFLAPGYGGWMPPPAL